MPASSNNDRERRERERARRAKDKKKKSGGGGGGGGVPKPNFKEKDLTPTGSLFDPNYNYGRTKDKTWYGTPLGKAHATQEPSDYVAWLMGNAGGPSGSGTQFSQYLNNDFMDTLDTGYRAALGTSGGRLGFLNYVGTLGQPSSPAVPSGGALNTGNPFTSSSFAAPATPTSGPHVPGSPIASNSVAPFTPTSGAPGLPSPEVGKHGKNKTPFLPSPQQAGTNLLEFGRKSYLDLVPSQRGINSATSMRPARWSVF